MRLFPAIALVALATGSTAAMDLTVSIDDETKHIAQLDCGPVGDVEVTFYPRSDVATLAVDGEPLVLLQKVWSTVAGVSAGGAMEFAETSPDLKEQYLGFEYRLMIMSDGGLWLRYDRKHYLQADECVLSGGELPQ